MLDATQDATPTHLAYVNGFHPFHPRPILITKCIRCLGQCTTVGGVPVSFQSTRSFLIYIYFRVLVTIQRSGILIQL